MTKPLPAKPKPKPSSTNSIAKPTEPTPKQKQKSMGNQSVKTSAQVVVAQPKPQTQATQPVSYNYGVLMAPGSSVWPATMKMTKGQRGQASTPAIFKTSANTIPVPKQPQKQPQKQKQTNKRVGVGTRSTTVVEGDLDKGESVFELSTYQLLMERKTRLRLDGMIDEANRIQAAVNVGMVLYWTEEEVVRTVKKSEGFASRGSDGPRARLTSKMMEVAAQEEVLGFESALAEDRRDDITSKTQHGFTRLMYLRSAFGRQSSEGSSSRQGTTNDKPELKDKIFAPLLLMKVQAALNFAFKSVWEAPDTEMSSDVSHGVLSQSFDTETFHHKAVYLLRVPNRQCGEEALRLLRNSKLGRKRFGDTDDQGRVIAALPGIERRLTLREKVELLDHVKTELPDGEGMIKATIETLGNKKSPSQALRDSGLVVEELRTRAITELDDEGFLLLCYMYWSRRGTELLVLDYVVDGEEEEEVESGEEGD